jgi:PIN domain nuclease of toxin-antitoxin system
MKYVIATNALIWFLKGNPRLGTNAKAILSQPESQLIIPATILAEAVWIVERGRTSKTQKLKYPTYIYFYPVLLPDIFLIIPHK